MIFKHLKSKSNLHMPFQSSYQPMCSPIHVDGCW